MDVKLYQYIEKFNPFAYLCEIWFRLYGVEVDRICSEYNWSIIGELPVIKIKEFMFECFEFIPVLKYIFFIDEDLSQEATVELRVLEEICVSKLHSSTLYTIWENLDICSNIYFPDTFSVHHIFSLFDFLIKRETNLENLKKFYKISSKTKAFEVAEESHRILSEILQGNKFFSSKYSAEDRPHSTDLIIYVFLHEELCYLSNDVIVTDSLNKYQNLVDFMDNMKNFISSDISLNKYLKLNIDENWLKSRSFKLPTDSKIEKVQEPNSQRRLFITVCAGLIAGFLMINS